MDHDADALRQPKVLDTAPDESFDNIVAFAADLCGTPTSLVSPIDRQRQWFKARVGFGSEQTDLDRSLCRHVVAEGRMVVVPDLADDPRTCDNPLVQDGPRFRF